jgi:hypothetical protein
MSMLKSPKSASLRALAAAVVLVTTAAPATLHAQSQPPAQQEDPGALAREAIDKLMRALSTAIQNLPQYAAPEVNERGDIIIRRLNPRAEQPSPPKSPAENPDETRT